MTDWFLKGFGKFADDVARGFASGIGSMAKEWEIFAYGRQVTGRATSITIGSLDNKSPSEKLGWDLPQQEGSPSQTQHRDRLANEPKGPDRGIDL